MTAKRRWFAFALVALMVGVASHSHAQDYPSRFIRVIVGPGPDITARVFGAKITEVLGQQVVVEPRPGAGGTIAAQAVAGAPGDGYTLLLASASYTINTAMGQSPLDLGRDFAPIALVATVPFVLVVHPSLRGEKPRRADRAGEGQPRQAQLCVVGHRHAAAPCRRAVQVHGRHRRRACAVSRGERRAQRRRGRLGRDDVLDRLDRRRADRRRQGARHRGHLALRLATRSRPAGDGGSGACRLFGAGMERIGGAQGNTAGDHRKAQFGRCNAASTTASCASGSWRRATSRRRAIRPTTSRASSTPTRRNGWRWWNRPR